MSIFSDNEIIYTIIWPVIVSIISSITMMILYEIYGKKREKELKNIIEIQNEIIKYHVEIKR